MFVGDALPFDTAFLPFPAVITGSVLDSGTYWYQWAEQDVDPTTGDYTDFPSGYGRTGTYDPTVPSGVGPTRELNNQTVADGTIVMMVLRGIVPGVNDIDLFYEFVNPIAGGSGSITYDILATDANTAVTPDNTWVPVTTPITGLAAGIYYVFGVATGSAALSILSATTPGVLQIDLYDSTNSEEIDSGVLVAPQVPVQLVTGSYSFSGLYEPASAPWSLVARAQRFNTGASNTWTQANVNSALGSLYIGYLKVG
jgi:hypothetical protein